MHHWTLQCTKSDNHLLHDGALRLSPVYMSHCMHNLLGL